MKEKVLLFAQRFGLVEKLKNLGYEVVLIDEKDHPLADYFIQLGEEKATFELDSIPLQQFKVEGDVAAVIPNGDLYVELVAKVRESLYPHCIGLPLSIASLVRDKFSAKKAAHLAGISTCKFSVLDSLSYSELVEKVGVPFLIKPRKLILARGIVLIKNEGQYKEWLKQNSSHVSRFYAEEYVEIEKELSCDTIVCEGKTVAQFPCEYTVPCLESSQTHQGFGALFPADLSSKEIEELKVMAQKLINVFGIQSAFCHLEFLKTSRGILYGEVNPRLPGGQHIAAESLMFGRDVRDVFLELYLRSGNGEILGPPMDGQKFYGYYLFPNRPGRIKSIENRLPSTPWVLVHSVAVKENDVISWLDSSVAASGFAVFGGESVSDLKLKMKTVSTLLEVTAVTS